MRHTNRLIMLVTFVATMVVGTSALFAFGRDADGSRMQARAHQLGQSASDRLSPPTDSVDWRYVRLKEGHTIEIVVSAPDKAGVRVSLTDAVGKNLASGRSKKGQAKIRRRVEPGLYYISVSSNQSCTYKVSIR